MLKFFQLLISISLLSHFFVQAQDPFVPASFSSKSRTYERPYHVCELPNNQFLFVGERSDMDSTGFVFITDNNGAVLKSKYLFARTDSTDYIGMSCSYNGDNSISIVGQNAINKVVYNANLVWYAKLDTNLNLYYTNEKFISNGDTLFYGLKNFVGINDAMYGALYYRLHTDISTLRTQLIKFDSKGEIALKRELDSGFFAYKYQESEGISSMTVSADKQHLLFNSLAPKGYITKVDTNFNITDTTRLYPKFFTSNPGDSGLYLTNPTCIEINQDNIVLGSGVEIYDAGTADFYRYWGVLKYNVKRKAISGLGGFTVENLERHSNNTFINIANSNDAVYTLGVKTEVFHKKSIVVSKFDSSANPVWIKYLGDTIHRYWPNSIYACKDGSVMINAFVDSASPVITNADFYIVRLDGKTGFPLSIRNVSEQLRKGISLYPNPGNDYVTLKGAAAASRLLLYNMLGQLVYDASIHSAGQSFSVQHLPAGTYSYQILGKEAEKISSGQWIKQ